MSSLLDEMNQAMALSFLIFLMADLRLMSATGRIQTKYETMTTDSDAIRRDCAAHIIGKDNDDEDDDDCNDCCDETASSLPRRRRRRQASRELSPSQCMALVLIEMRHALSKDKDKRNNKDNNNDDDNASSFTEFLQTAKRRPKALQGNLHKNLLAYADMIGHDLVEKVPYIEARQSRLRLVVQQQQQQPGNNNSDTIPGILQVLSLQSRESGNSNHNNSHNNNPHNQNGSSTTTGEDASPFSSDDNEENHHNNNDDNNEDNNNNNSNPASATTRLQQKLLQRANSMRNLLLYSQQGRQVLHMQQVTDALFNMNVDDDDDDDDNVPATTKQPQQRQQAKNTETPVFKRPALLPSSKRTKPTTTTTNNGTSSSAAADHLLTRLEKAVETRNPNKLKFMENFFRPGSISQLLVQSPTRFVWIHDFYPLKDLTYAIGIDVATKRVQVVFRGAITRQDWSMVLDVSQQRPVNPIVEEYPGKTATVNVHSGFYRYLFRVRQDTGTTKFQEIVSLTHRYGTQYIGNDYTVAVIGHSLGAALSTVFTFFASADDRLVRNGPIHAFTFGSPYVGGHDFADAFRHQEECHKIRYARFYNHNDIVAYVPANVTITHRGALYRHVGMAVKIPQVPQWWWFAAKWRPWKVRVYYVGREGCFRSYRRAVGRNFLWHSPLVVSRIPTMHSLAELQERTRDGKFKRKGLQGDYEMLHQTLEQLYQDFVGVQKKKQPG